jgi:hypothetical protein
MLLPGELLLIKLIFGIVLTSKVALFAFLLNLLSVMVALI